MVSCLAAAHGPPRGSAPGPVLAILGLKNSRTCHVREFLPPPADIYAYLGISACHASNSQARVTLLTPLLGPNWDLGPWLQRPWPAAGDPGRPERSWFPTSSFYFSFLRAFRHFPIIYQYLGLFRRFPNRVLGPPGAHGRPRGSAPGPVLATPGLKNSRVCQTREFWAVWGAVLWVCVCVCVCVCVDFLSIFMNIHECCPRLMQW